MKKLFVGILCLVLFYSLAVEAKEGNNSRIQSLEAEIENLKNQLSIKNNDAGTSTNVIMLELCNLYDLTGNNPPLFCKDCGNNTLEFLEECDDGNIEGGDGCSSYCLWEECGNGVVDVNEECDDGNVDDGDLCSSSCQKSFKLVFLTNGSYGGNLGGLTGADNICMTEASVAGLSGTFKAWLSDRNLSVSERLIHSSQMYALIDGTPVANNWYDLTDGSIINPINKDAYGNEINDYVWTFTFDDGNRLSYYNYDCFEWNIRSYYNGYYGYTGYSGSSDSWTYASSKSCNNKQRLFCFEQ